MIDGCMSKLEEREIHRCFDGTLGVYSHASNVLNCSMTFSLFIPDQAKEKPVPLLTFLSGLTCTHENFTTKAGAYKTAAEEGIAILAPDTSPRGDQVADDKDAYDFGQGAGFYINATEEPWAKHYRMEDYIADELNRLICNQFPINSKQQGICGHSMGGHGALTLYLKYPERYCSVSAFSPIVAPSQVPWGKKAFAGYLGDNQKEWQKHDACSLMKASEGRDAYPPILIDQGLADQFLDEQLKSHLFEAACQEVNQSLTLHLHEGYDHSYYFIQSFIADHIKHHKRIFR